MGKYDRDAYENAGRGLFCVLVAFGTLIVGTVLKKHKDNKTIRDLKLERDKAVHKKEQYEDVPLGKIIYSKEIKKENDSILDYDNRIENISKKIF